MIHYINTTIHKPDSTIFEVTYQVIFGNSGAWLYLRAGMVDTNYFLWYNDILIHNDIITWKDYANRYEKIPDWKYPLEFRKKCEKLHKMKAFW